MRIIAGLVSAAVVLGSMIACQARASDTQAPPAVTQAPATGAEAPAPETAPVASAPMGYEEACGACHMVYQPWLLPAGSWQQVMAALPEHNGEQVELDAATIKAVTAHLTGLAAETSSHKRAVKIMESLGGATPTRITAVPYIQKKHRKIRAAIFARPAVGSLANCVACHPAAVEGVFEEDTVKIPS